MAIKIGKWYITRNNPREILNISREKQDRIDSAIDYIKENAWYCYKDNEAILDRIGIEKTLNILQNGSEEK